VGADIAWLAVYTVVFVTFALAAYVVDDRRRFA